MTRLLLAITFTIFSITAQAQVFEKFISIEDTFTSNISLDISELISNNLKGMKDLSKKRIIAIELDYKAVDNAVLGIKWQAYSFNAQIIGDMFDFLDMGFTENAFINTRYSRINLSKNMKMSLSVNQGEVYIRSISLTIAESNKYHRSPQSCTYKLDSIFGATNPFYQTRTSYGTSKNIAGAFACEKAKQACKDRMLSPNFETCRKSQKL